MMIGSVFIRNFKSVRELEFDARRVNVFIGEANAGKSNILEALSLFSIGYTNNLGDLVRIERISNLFYDENTDEPIIIKCDDFHLKLYRDGVIFRFIIKRRDEEIVGVNLDFNARIIKYGPMTRLPFKKYKYTPLSSFPSHDVDSLKPPFGDNLMALLLTRRDLKELVANLVRSFGLRLVLKPQESKIELLKYYEQEDIFVSIPYHLISDTLRRAIFYLVAIKSNKDSIILLEEPEVHSFPSYTKVLAEIIGLDRHNQYFITTHNPYFLLSLIEKTPASDLNIFITYMENYQTKVRRLTSDEISEIASEGIDIFFNIDMFREE